MSGPTAPRIVSVGTANPPTSFSQREILALFDCDDPKIRQFFESSHIQSRCLVLPDPGPDGKIPDEDGKQLLDKHLRVSIEMGREAIGQCLKNRGIRPEQVDFLATVSSTGFLCPGLSAYLVSEMGFRENLQRADILGMGCNAGMNGLSAVHDFAKAHPGKIAILFACEVCSAAYVFDLSVRTGVVNSLFGDGAAAVMVVADDALSASEGPMLVDFESQIVPSTIDEMRFDFDQGKFNFFLGKDVPYLIGERVERPIDSLLSRNNLHRRDIKHWLIHSGGKKVVDAIKYNLGLTEHDVRHTRSILKDFGNMSSASFLFSYRELTLEKIAKKGDWGVAIAMGPGVSIETGLLLW